jgi:hypothetical protein
MAVLQAPAPSIARSCLARAYTTRRDPTAGVAAPPAGWSWPVLLCFRHEHHERDAA